MGPERLVAAVHTRGHRDAAASEAERTAAGLFPQTMSVMGNRWAFRASGRGVRRVSRFTDFQTQLGAPPGSIADRLSIFTSNGVLGVSDNRYRLTEKGRALFPVLVTALELGPAVVPGARRPGGDPHPYGMRPPIQRGPDVRSVRRPLRGAHVLPDAAKLSLRAKTPQKFLALSSTRVLISQVHSDLAPARGAGPE